MQITYDWTVKRMNTKLSADGLVNVVVSVDWKISGTTEVDGKTYISMYDGTVGMALPTGEFTPYQDLSKEQVLSWVWSRGINKQEAEDYIAGQLQLQIAPPIKVLPNPWA